MKKKTTVLVGLLMAVVLTAYSVSGTYAKYTTSGGTTDSARVARWNIKVNDTNTETVKLFNTTYGDNDEVKSSTDDAVVAPGTSGVYTASISGTAEVAYQVDTEIEIENNVLYSDNTSPIKLSLDGKTWYEYNDAAFEALLEETITAKAGEEAGTVSIYWKWAYDKTDLATMTGITVNDTFDYDAEDTTLGQTFMNGSEEAYKTAYDAKYAEEIGKVVGEPTEADKIAADTLAKQAGEEARKNATVTEPDITITVSITATQIDSQTGTVH